MFEKRKFSFHTRAPGISKTSKQVPLALKLKTLDRGVTRQCPHYRRHVHIPQPFTIKLYKHANPFPDRARLDRRDACLGDAEVGSEAILNIRRNCTDIDTQTGIRLAPSLEFKKQKFKNCHYTPKYRCHSP